MSSKEATELTKVEPIHHRKGDFHEYKYGKVAVEDIDLDEIDTRNVSVAETDKVDKDGRAIYWKYTGKPAVVITEDGCYTESNNRVETERQAYFALSILDSKGYVQGFRRVR